MPANHARVNSAAIISDFAFSDAVLDDAQHRVASWLHGFVRETMMDSSEYPALLECGSGRKLADDEALAASWLDTIGISWRATSQTEISRRKVDVLHSPLVAGGVPFMRAAIRELCAEMPLDDCYPQALRSFLGRGIQRMELRQALAIAENGIRIFVKPAVRTKRFTGFVLDGTNAWTLSGVSRHEPVWTSAPVCFLSEWRLYVVQGKVVFTSHCDGNRLLAPDQSTLDGMLSCICLHQHTLPSAFALDIGITGDGHTVLLEVNDGYALGAYDHIPAKVYGEFLVTRWSQFKIR